jgi:hypothetical protein
LDLLIVSAIVFTIVLGAALAGMHLRGSLPKQHLIDESRKWLLVVSVILLAGFGPEAEEVREKMRQIFSRWIKRERRTPMSVPDGGQSPALSISPTLLTGIP